MAALDFTHSNRRAWSLLPKLGGATHSKRQQPTLTVNEVSHLLRLNGSIKKDRKQAKHILKQQLEALSDCPEASNLLQAFTTDEIINAIKATEAVKAAWPDGIFPDNMLKNIGSAAVRWLQAFYHEVMTTANIPKDKEISKCDSPNLDSLSMISLLTRQHRFLRESYHQIKQEETQHV